MSIPQRARRSINTSIPASFPLPPALVNEHRIRGLPSAAGQCRSDTPSSLRSIKHSLASLIFSSITPSLHHLRSTAHLPTNCIMTLVPQPNDCFTSIIYIYTICHRFEPMRCTNYFNASRDLPQGKSTTNRTLNTSLSGRPASERVPGVFVFRFVGNYHPAGLLWLAFSFFPAFLDKLIW
jgi:hypothetical protein